MQRLAEGTVLGPYTVVRLIGRGGMGEVYEAYEPRLERRVALKAIAPKKVGEVNLIMRFLHEARTLAQVNHPNVVTIHSIETVNEVQFIAMEYVEGAVFSDMFALFALSAIEAAPIFQQVLEGIHALHEKNILHRDIKPGNLILRADGQVKILDFGIAKRASDVDPDNAAGKLVGTMAYLPPEVILGARADSRSDLWSLGAIFYECLVGEPLVSNFAKKIVGAKVHADSSVVFPQEALERIRPEMRAIVARLCEKDPEARYRSAAEAIEDLKRFQQKFSSTSAQFHKAFPLVIGKIEEIKIIAASANLKDHKHEKRNFTLLLLKEAAQSLVSEPLSPSEVEDTHIPLDDEIVSMTSDSIMDRQKFRKKLKRKGQGTLWRSLLLANLIVMAGVVLWLGTQNFHHKSLEKIAVAKVIEPIAPPPPSLSLITPTAGQTLWLEPTQVPTFTWSKPTTPTDYQLEISSDLEFKNILVSESVTGNSYRPSRALPDGPYYWRLLTSTKTPLAGPVQFSISQITPLELTSPTERSSFETSSATKDYALDFKWPCKVGANLYHVQLSHRPDFTPTLRESTLSGCTWSQVHLAAGKYFWRVKVESPMIDAYPWSAPGKFAIRHGRTAPVSMAAAPPAPTPVPVPVRPKVQPAPVPAPVAAKPMAPPTTGKPVAPPQLFEAISVFKLDPKDITVARDIASLRLLTNSLPKLRWHEVKGAHAYVIEISRSPDFTRMIQKSIVSTPYFEWEKMSLGKFYWHVAAVGAGEVKGPFSTFARLDVRLPAPVLSSAYSYSTNGFEWEAVSLAEKYIVQWSPDRSMVEPSEKMTDKAQVQLKMENDTVYVRIAAANRRGEQLSEFSRVTRVSRLPASEPLK